MRKRMVFLVTVGAILIGFIALLGWGSTFFFNNKLEPAFLGALVSASGTIFAACVAYTAASMSIEMTKETAAQNAIASANAQRSIKQGELNQVKIAAAQDREALEHLEKMLARFDLTAFDPVTVLADPKFSGPIAYFGQAPPPISAKMQEAYARLHNLQIGVNSLAGLPADQAVTKRADLNSAIREHLREMSKLRGEIGMHMIDREKEVEALARELGL